MTINQADTQDELRAPSSILAHYLRRSISLSHMAKLVWKRRLLIVAAAIGGMLYGIYTVHAAGPTFVATMGISPAESDSTFGEGGSSAGSLLAGLTGGGGTASLPRFTQFTLAIPSVGVARDLDDKYGLLCRIFRGACDPVTHQWRERTGFQPWFDGLLARLSGLPDPNGARTVSDLAAYIGGTVAVVANKNNAMVSVSYENSDPEFAAQFLSRVVKATNDHVRAQSRETQRRYVEYLTESAARTANVEQRTAIDTLLLQEERQLMMTEVDVPYAAKVLDGPTVMPVNTALKKIMVSTFTWLVLGAVATLFLELLPRKWRFW